MAKKGYEAGKNEKKSCGWKVVIYVRKHNVKENAREPYQDFKISKGGRADRFKKNH